MPATSVISPPPPLLVVIAVFVIVTGAPVVLPFANAGAIRFAVLSN